MTTKLKNSLEAFPRAQVESALTDWWDQRSGSALVRHRSPEECRRLEGTVFDIQPAVSFIETVTAMVELEALLGFEFVKNAIPRGGYNSREQFVRDLTSRLQIEYAKHYGLTGEIAFRGVFVCAHCRSAMTSERKKGKYVYYRCTGYRGKCRDPTFSRTGTFYDWRPGSQGYSNPRRGGFSDRRISRTGS